MAYIIGLLTDEDIGILEGRGWELEECPKELIPPDPTPGMTMKMIWVDSGMVDIMSGPGWEMHSSAPPHDAATATGMYDRDGG